MVAAFLFFLTHLGYACSHYGIARSGLLNSLVILKGVTLSKRLRKTVAFLGIVVLSSCAMLAFNSVIASATVPADQIGFFGDGYTTSGYFPQWTLGRYASWNTPGFASRRYIEINQGGPFSTNAYLLEQYTDYHFNTQYTNQRNFKQSISGYYKAYCGNSGATDILLVQCNTTRP